jgi:hypothetical protein
MMTKPHQARNQLQKIILIPVLSGLVPVLFQNNCTKNTDKVTTKLN